MPHARSLRPYMLAIAVILAIGLVHDFWLRIIFIFVAGAAAGLLWLTLPRHHDR